MTNILTGGAKYYSEGHSVCLILRNLTIDFKLLLRSNEYNTFSYTTCGHVQISKGCCILEAEGAKHLKLPMCNNPLVTFSNYFLINVFEDQD